MDQTKIQNLCLPALRQEKVRALNVAVDDAGCMGDIEGVGHLDSDVDEKLGGNWLTFDAVLQRAAFKAIP